MVERPFDQLKLAMCTTPLLALLVFTKTFVIKSDACKVDIGVVLMQEGHPLTYMSKASTSKNLPKSPYEKQMLEIIQLVTH